MVVFRTLYVGLAQGLSRRFISYSTVFLLCFLSYGALAVPVVTDIRVGVEREVTRIVFEFTDAMNAQVSTLSAPYRIVIDLPEVGWSLPPHMHILACVWARRRFPGVSPPCSQNIRSRFLLW